MGKQEKYEYFKMMRANQRSKQKEEQLDSKNAWQISDPTPKAAVKNIIGGAK